ncbi:hypothetical protein EIP91_002592 [Steccherinum ochraceum]|uniref:Uncharacterized protein n=1 Tax=Steccherinum ochraceum TaxID=92696 RepID=A0A4R0RSL5_9APHY|nr:hypothetical protein EIP91_002592 [Steccherinum ochraceum]
MSVSWNTTFDDASPVLQYAPYSDGPLKSGWQAMYSGVPNSANATCGEAAVGDSTHITSLSGASVALQFYGTAIYLYGGGNCSYQVSLDNEVENLSPPSADLLYSKEDLSLGTHYVNLTALPSQDQQLVFDRAITTDSLPANASPPTTMVVDNSNITAVQYFGSWTSKTDAHVPNASHPMPFHITTSSGSYASLDFTGGIAVAINGSKNCGHGAYTVKLFDSSQQLQTSADYNASTNWLVGDSLLYYHSGLDPSKSYQIQLINSAGDGTTLTLGDFTVLQSNITSVPTQSPSDPSSGSGHHKTNVGVIVGPVIAGVAVLVILHCSRCSAEFPSDGPGSQPSNNTNNANANGVTTIREKGSRTHLLQHPPNQQQQVEGAAVAVPVSSGGGTTGTGTRQSSSRPSTPHSHSHSRSASNPGPHPTQASSQSQSSLIPPPSQAQPQVDVNRIIELIAARIDRPVPNAPTVEDEGAPPPQYPVQPDLQPLRRPPQAQAADPPRYRKR